MADLTRCQKSRDGRVCGYRLHDGVCPVCEGKQASDRLPMLAPLPKAREMARTRVYAFPKRRGAA